MLVSKSTKPPKLTSNDLAPMDEGNGEKHVRSRSMNQYGHMII